MHAHNDPDRPNPKRFYWLKRFAVASAVLVVLLVGLRLVWGHRVQARLDQAIADIHAKGEPILFEDLVYEPLADTDNGAWYLMQALHNWPSVPGQPGMTIHDTDWYNEGEEAGHTDPITDNAAYLASCQSNLDLLRQAGKVERSAWSTTLTRPLFYLFFQHLGDCRELARYLDDAAYRALASGDTELVFESMLLQHTISRHVIGQTPFLLDGLVAISIMAMNRDFIEKALPQIDPIELRQGPTRERAEQVIASLTDGMLREAFIQSFIGERAFSYDVYECLIDGTETAANFIGSDSPITWVIDTPGLQDAYRPALKHEQLITIRYTTELIEALQNGASLTNLQTIDQAFVDKFLAAPLLYPLQGLYLSSYGSSIRTYFRSEALLRCAAVAIAIKLYEADHGQRPDTLDQLVPDYIAAIPVDPFSKTGEPIRYNPAGVVPTIEDAGWLTDEQLAQLKQQAIRPYPLLYSVGEDGIAQSGGPLFINEYGELDDSDRYNSYRDEPGDIWLMLDPWPQAIFTDQDLGIEDDPFGFNEPWDEPDEPEEDGDSEAGDHEIEVQPNNGQDNEDQAGQPQP